MRKLLILTFVFFAALQAVEAVKYESAHVIPVSVFQGKTYVIFGVTQKGVLDDFGGLRDIGETDPKMTAARETEEEALGVLGSKECVRKRLSGPVNEVAKDRGHPHYILPAKDYGPIFKKFNNRRFGSQKLSHYQMEMVELVAIEIDEVRKGVRLYDGRVLKVRAPNGKLYSVRRGAGGAIVSAVKKGFL
ncbi:MAG: hypothetical protein K940chlam3_00954 [Chlamydiae bacterium]|nr:hypothetical protein [Chlamydiota bacterium]